MIWVINRNLTSIEYHRLFLGTQRHGIICHEDTNHNGFASGKRELPQRHRSTEKNLYLPLCLRVSVANKIPEGE